MEKLKEKCKKNIKPHFLEIMKDVGISAEKVNEECKIVGGVVRDCLLNTENDDLDFVCTNVDKVAEDLILQGKAKDIGVKITDRYKTKILLIEKGNKSEKIDLVEPRKEIYVKDSIKPIVEKGDFNTDAYRRDFTINTLRIDVNPKNFFKIEDPTGKGLEDLENKILKTPLEPDQTFTDDPTRMLRAVRFSACKNMKIDKNVINSIQKNKDQINRVPSELIHKEFMKGMQCKDYFRTMNNVGLLDTIIPELKETKGLNQLKSHHTEDVFNHTLNYIDNLPNEPILQLTGLLHDIGKVKTSDIEGHSYKHEEESEKESENILKRLKFSNDDINKVKKLVKNHMILHTIDLDNISDKGIKRLINKYNDILPELEIMSKADIKSDNPNKEKALQELELKINKINEVKKQMNELISNQFKLEISGNDIMNLGYKGKDIGKIKSIIEQKVIDGELPNNKEILLKELNKITIK